jgi:hypothetical protein
MRPKHKGTMLYYYNYVSQRRLNVHCVAARCYAAEIMHEEGQTRLLLQEAFSRGLIRAFTLG